MDYGPDGQLTHDLPAYGMPTLLIQRQHVSECLTDRPMRLLY